jgi:hypothetical protein
MIIFTSTTNINFPLVILKDEYLVLNTNRKMKYLHLYIKTSLSEEDSIKYICGYLETNNQIKQDLDIQISEEGIKVEKSLKDFKSENVTEGYCQEIRNKLKDLEKEDRKIENILSKLHLYRTL